MTRVFLGIDTSNYTTSLALVSGEGKLVGEKRQILQVPQGQRGLRQSEAVFQHVRNLPGLLEELFQEQGIQSSDLAGIGVSTRPRPQDDSYMPVFLPGHGLGRSLAATLQIPLVELSHQENHLWAGLMSAGGPKSRQFLAVHLSGGTTELVKVHIRDDYRMDIDILGGTSDLHAGQFVDRVGVALGLPFPAGPHLEKLVLEKQAGRGTPYPVIPSYHREGMVSFAGQELAAKRLIGQAEPAQIAYAVFICVARTLEKLIKWGWEQTGLREVLLVGGVAANKLIRGQLVHRLRESLFFAQPKLSTDNAVGAAFFSGLSTETIEFLGMNPPKHS